MDMCSLCNKVNQLKDMGTLDEDTKLKHQEHIKNKNNDKGLAKKSPHFHVTTFAGFDSDQCNSLNRSKHDKQ
jgi:hypothetical protein